jgi:hypothetical protein
MATSPAPRNYTLDEGEKVTAVMIYTSHMLIWGDVVTKAAMRVSTWLRTPSVPRYFFMHDANIVMISGSSPSKPHFFSEIHLPVAEAIAFHMKPPAHDPIDYDPNEPMRKMMPVTALAGLYRFYGTVRMSVQTALEKFLEVSKETFIGLYDAEITLPSIPAMGVIRVPYTLLRSDRVAFSPHNA